MVLVMKGNGTGVSGAAASMAVPTHGQAVYPWSGRGVVDVEDLVVWAFADQRADGGLTEGLFEIEALAEGYEWRGRSGCGCAQVDAIARVGCQIDVSGGPVNASVHPAAELVVALVQAAGEGELIRHWARMGCRPGGWSVPQRWLGPEAWVVPDVEAMWVYADRRARPHCPLMPVSSPDGVASARDRYQRWWDALDDLAWHLSMKPLGFTVLPPSAPRAPWSVRDRA